MSFFGSNWPRWFSICTAEDENKSNHKSLSLRGWLNTSDSGCDFVRYCKAPPRMRNKIHRVKMEWFGKYKHHILPNKTAEFVWHFPQCIFQCNYPLRTYAKSMFYRLASRALAGREHTQLIRISVSLGSDRLNVSLSNASASQSAFSLGNFGAPEACVISSLGYKLTKLQPCQLK